MKKIFTILLATAVNAACFSQNIGIGTTSPNTSAALDISNTAKGLLIPRMTSNGITAIPNPAKGLMVYDSVYNQLMINMGPAQIPNWQNVVSSSGWGLQGNSGIGSSFIGTTDGSPLVFKVSNIKSGYIDSTAKTGNTGFGFMALNANTTGVLNGATGYQSLASNTTGVLNVANGFQSLFLNTSGSNNTAVGVRTLYSNIFGSQNTAVGERALYQNNGSQNTAIGVYTLDHNTTGSQNSATGYFALYNNATGQSNAAFGVLALSTNENGNYNTASGSNSLFDNVSGNYNTATGYKSLYTSSSGEYNTAVGAFSMLNNSGSLGSYNTTLGSFALYNTTNSQFNTVVGYRAGDSYNVGYNNTILGAYSDAAFEGACNDIAIGLGVTCNDNSQARIGNSATYSIGGYANWTNISDGRYKKNLKENVQGLAFIMKLRPVTYNLDITGLSNKLNESHGGTMNVQMRKAIAEKEQVVQTGFVAQEVEQAANQTGYAFSGVDKPRTDAGLYGLRYAEFVVPLVKAMQEQQEIIADLKKQNESLLQRMEKLETFVNTKK